MHTNFDNYDWMERGENKQNRHLAYFYDAYKDHSQTKRKQASQL